MNNVISKVIEWASNNPKVLLLILGLIIAYFWWIEVGIYLIIISICWILIDEDRGFWALGAKVTMVISTLVLILSLIIRIKYPEYVEYIPAIVMGVIVIIFLFFIFLLPDQSK